MDAFKQLRSMILLELCCPPLPVMATRQETGEQTVTNTHDMLSVFMITAFNRQNADENSRRKQLQIDIVRAYQDGLDRCTSFTEAYAHMERFATSYLASYLEGTGCFSREDIQILPPDYISPHLTEEIRSYCKALRLLSGQADDPELADHGVDALFMSCISSAIYKKQQSVVGVPVLVGMGEDIGEESHNPQAFEPGIEVL